MTTVFKQEWAESTAGSPVPEKPSQENRPKRDVPARLYQGWIGNRNISVSFSDTITDTEMPVYCSITSILF